MLIGVSVAFTLINKKNKEKASYRMENYPNINDSINMAYDRFKEVIKPYNLNSEKEYTIPMPPPDEQPITMPKFNEVYVSTLPKSNLL